MENGKKQRAFTFFLVAVVCTALATGLSEGVYSNFYKEVYDVSAAQRGFIEFPRELPGLITVLVISALSIFGEMRLAILAQVISIIGLVLLGVFTPSFNVMLVFLFINSMGMHLYMPLRDSIGLSIIGSENTGSRFGMVNAVQTAATFAAGLAVFLGFRSGVFGFPNAANNLTVTPSFLIATAFFVGVIIMLIRIQRLIGNPAISTGEGRILFRKEYTHYYILASLHGAHKQIAGVFGPWVLIEILLRQADTMAILGMAGSFLGIFFIPFVGRLTDRLGVKRMLLAEGFLFIVVYIMYGMVAAGLMSGNLAKVGIPVLLVYALYIIDRMTMQLAMVRTLYLRSIARDASEISPTLSTGMSIDHVISIVCAYLGGLAWAAWGPQYVFYIASALSLGNVLVALALPRTGEKTAEV